ncbi:Alternative oxidase [Blastocystis sp. ATCC 50177/Nand II]|uniref:Alternative oxidase n=1 Tax=Blastocystis sp. subtype 1 (strain ATCC 50177 / NandII) TaxID=478820 RepID=D3GDI7_BLAHN|nr:mitochondrial alternative oxidase [Blastocystis sp. ATCC 50177/Nand II]OAO18117.1 Alternative oxidase [Blastocystis sp. ATCC 50177/Nand II]
MFPILSRVFFKREAVVFRGFSVSSYEQFIDKECISKALNKKPNEHYHIFSTRYHSSNREYLTILESCWGEQPKRHPKGVSDRVASGIVNALFKIGNAYFRENYILRAVFLESVASIPGLVCSNLHHLRCLRRLQPDSWIKPLVDEAENERMHLLAVRTYTKLTAVQKLFIRITQFSFVTLFSFLFVFAPRTSHRLVGFLEEHAVDSYTEMIRRIDSNTLENRPATQITKDYWGLPEDATLRDALLVIRADEADHRLVNHSLGDAYDKKTPVSVKKWYAGCAFPVNLHEPFGPYMDFSKYGATKA